MTSQRRGRYRNTFKPRKLETGYSTPLREHDVDFGNGGESESWSPTKPKDNIDWSVTNEDVEELKSRVLPHYWHLLLNSFGAIVRVTDRLYILQDWDYKGHLKVHTFYKKTYLKDSSLQACIPND